MTNSKTILVVDDDSMIRDGLQTVLQKNGYRILEAEDGVEATNLIDRYRPDLVILDMMMSRWGGFAVLEHYQNNPAAPPFIMLSGHDGEKHKAYAKQIGAVDYLQKPCSMERLLSRVNTLLRPPETAPSEPATFRITCPGCGARIKAPAQLESQTRPCPRCGHSFVVHEGPVDEGPRLMLEC